MLKKLDLLLLLLLICFTACQPSDITDPLSIDEDDEDEIALVTSMSYKIDGQLIQASFSDDTILDLGFAGGDLTKTTNGTIMTISSGLIADSKIFAVILYITTNKLYNDLKVGDTFSGEVADISNLTFAAFGIEDLILEETTFSSSDVDETDQNLKISISEIDHETNIISGTFSFDAYDPELNHTIKITEGRFTNLLLDEN